MTKNTDWYGLGRLHGRHGQPIDAPKDGRARKEYERGYEDGAEVRKTNGPA